MDLRYAFPMKLQRSLVLLFAIVFPVLAHAAPYIFFRDVTQGDWYEGALRSLVQQKYIDTSKELFRPNDPALRSEFVKLLLLMNLQLKKCTIQCRNGWTNVDT